VQKTKKILYGMVFAQAQRIDVDATRVIVTFGPQQGALKLQLDQHRPWLEELATRLAGHKMTVVAAEGSPVPVPGRPGEAARGAASGAAGEGDKQTALKQKAMADSGVQAMLDVFRTDIKEVEEM
jgi:hypothetical protein